MSLTVYEPLCTEIYEIIKPIDRNYPDVKYYKRHPVFLSSTCINQKFLSSNTFQELRIIIEVMKRMGPSRFRQVGERCSVIQVESESPLGNQRLKQKVNANNIVSFARKDALVAA